jgi:hypothetical protein
MAKHFSQSDFNAALINASKALLGGVSGSAITSLGQTLGQRIADQLQDALGSALSAECTQDVYWQGIVKVDIGPNGPLPGIEGWTRTDLAAWKLTVRVSVLDQSPLLIKCKDALQARRIRAALRSTIRSPSFALDWRASVNKAIAPITAGYDADSLERDSKGRALKGSALRESLRTRAEYEAALV